MDQILNALQKIAEAIRFTSGAVVVAKGRVAKQHGRAVKAHRKRLKAEKAADRLRKEGHPKRAAAKDARAARLHARELKASAAAQSRIAQVKRLNRKMRRQEQTQAELKEEAARWRSENGVTISGNKATGGTKRQRLKAVALAAAAGCASGKRPNFYSLTGGWDVDRAITGESRDKRSDCSQWVTAVYKAAGLADPNRNDFRGGFTGTLVAHGRSISRSDLKPGDLIIYGSGSGFHVEMFVGPGDKTIGHGSAPVDAGIVDLVGGPKQYRSYI
jgi:cell wall-associated NlpC family hydrolase